MSRTLRVLLILALVASCGRGVVSPNAPGNLDNACNILREHPNFSRAFRSTERRWGVPIHVQMATIYQESRFRPNARTPLRYTLGIIPIGRQSSAFGYAQAIDSTWKEYKRARGRPGARRNDIRDAADFMGWYMAGSRRELGISLGNARAQYLAYHEGRTGYKRRTYRTKNWLVKVSNEVASRAKNYERQLKSCKRYT